MSLVALVAIIRHFPCAQCQHGSSIFLVLFAGDCPLGVLPPPLPCPPLLASVKGLLVVTVFTVLSFSARLLDEMEMAWYLLLVTRTGTSAL